jgi:hypothetical protein
VLLAVKLFPWSLLALNPFYFALRLIAGAAAAGRGAGDTAHFPGIAGKLRMLGALLAGDLAALAMLPRTLRKRSAIKRMGKLSPREVRQLIMAHRLRLGDVA